MSAGLTIRLAEHPRLAPRAFVARFEGGVDREPSPGSLVRMLALEADTPMGREEEVRKAVRDMLRWGGYKPTGRGKPSSEYLVRAAGEEKLGSINRAVDVGNAASLASGLPISVVDLGRVVEELEVRVAEEGTRYVFNRSGQEIDVGGLVCLFDGQGACANAVKDAQRTKTGEGTERVLVLVWGVVGFEERGEGVERWGRHLVEMCGGEVEVEVGFVRE